MNFENLYSIEQATVYKGKSLAGVLSRTKNGARFDYDKDYFEQSKANNANSIAFQMPIIKSTYFCAGYNLHPFFSGLLPEGLRLEALYSKLKTSKDDMFSILLASSPDLIGDISLSIDEKNLQSPAIKSEVPSLDSVVFSELFLKSLYSTDTEQRMRDLTIAGIQDKISAHMISFPLGVINRKNQYILKLTPKKFPQIVENEFFFMTLAKACKIRTAEVQLIKDVKNNSGLLVTRFDRDYMSTSKSFNKVHQEDACQFLNRYPSDKYRITIQEIIDGIFKFCSAPLLELHELLRLIAFSYLIGNGDLHGKNISLIVESNTGRIRLSPAYDLLSTYPYGDKKMALKFEGRDDNLKRRDFVALGERYGMQSIVIKEMLDELGESISSKASRLEQIKLGKTKTRQLEKLIEKRLLDLK